MLFSRIYGTVLTMAFCVPAWGAIIATDENIPIQMEAGGSASDPAQYILGQGENVSVIRDYAWVGAFSSHNRLTIRNGAHYETNGEVQIGYQTYAGYNAVEITGPGTRWTNAGAFNVGFHGKHNTLTLSDGASLENTGSLSAVSIGYTVNSSNNAAILTGAGTTWDMNGFLYVGSSGQNNSLSILQGASLTTGRTSYVGSQDTATGNRVTVSGAGSSWRAQGAIHIYGGDNILTVADGGLAASALNLTFNAAMDGIARIDDGFLALAGQKTAYFEQLIQEDAFHYWDASSESWLAGDSGHFEIRYFSPFEEADALAFSGHAGLAGYTIVTTSIPEPSFSLLALTSASVPLLLRRRNACPGKSHLS